MTPAELEAFKKENRLGEYALDEELGKELNKIFRNRLNRDLGRKGADYWEGEYKRAIERGDTPEAALASIDKAVSESQEAKYQGAPDWFTPDSQGGSAIGTHGHEADYQLNLDPNLVQGFSPWLNDAYGYFQGNTLGREGAEYWTEQYQDHVTHLVNNEGYSFTDADALVKDNIEKNIQQNPLHVMYGITGAAGYGQPNYITNPDGTQSPVYFDNTSTTLGFNPSDPNQPFYNPLIAAAGGYQPYDWKISENPNVPGGLQINPQNEAAQTHFENFSIQTGEQGVHNPFQQFAIGEAGSPPPTVTNIEAGSAPHGLYVNQFPAYAEALQSGDFSGGAQGVSGTFKKNNQGQMVLHPHLNHINVYGPDGTFIGNNPLGINQNPGAYAQLTTSVNPFDVDDPNQFLESPLINDPYGVAKDPKTGGPVINPNTGQTYYNEEGVISSGAYQTKLPKMQQIPMMQSSGGGGGNTTIINEQTQKNKTAEQQQIKENIRPIQAGQNRRYYKRPATATTAIPGVGGGLNIPGVG